ncbi:bifunctional RNase H/acid phosphatase [Streptomyces sp. 1-11]|uniref:bifunctional RNase H/acid phosphatase n=2 Tax=unclassified Streptomyces TaxID=2593676 RepID=UPI0011713405|nr:bifunctional RNase H/acid phosphatase [Streptomyces sp. 1-11]GEK00617.1 bifunctional RNase H/acid phosphatase [Streptomyces sp. 1-11]
MREFIVEADGGSRGNPGPAGYGAVVSDAATGETLAEAAEYLGVVTNNVAEYRGLLAGLRTAHALDPTARVHVRMDSKLVVEQMSGRWKIKHPDMKPLAAEANRVFPPGQVTYEWIPRAQNTHADRLANEAMDAGARGEQWSASGDDVEAEAVRQAAGPARTPGTAAGGSAAAAGATQAGTGVAADATETGTGVAADATQAGTPVAADAAEAGTAVAAGGRAAAGAARVDAAAPAVEGRPAAPGERRPAGSAEQSRTRGWSAAPDLGAPATLVLLRHGETPLTPQKRFSGSGGTDPSLSDAGREQARRAAAALARRGTVQAVVASPLARTQETARIVAARLGLDVTVDEGLRETDFGAWEGLTFGEVRERHPDDLNAWLADPEAHPTGGGESFAETAVRIAATRDKLVAAHAGRTVLLVTHVTPIKTLIRLALDAPPKSLFRMELSAASLSAVAYYADGNASVRLFNDTSHLRP